MTVPLTIWGAGTSRTLRVIWAAIELDLDFEHRPIGARTGETQTPEYLALNPRGKVPVLVHGDVVLSESAAIMGYLSEAFLVPETFFVPRDASERAQLNEWCYFIMTELDAHPLYIIRRHAALSHIYGTAPEAVDSAREYFARQVNAMAGRVEARGHYLMGERLGVADILLKTTLDWAEDYGLPLPNAFARYARRLAARPQYRQARERNKTPRA